jgi:Flp pilus assembly protein TadD
MRCRRFIPLVAIVLGACRGSSPTFNREIAPLVWARCSPCHRPGQSGPFSLITYQDVRSRARQIVSVTKNRIMPPWLPDPGSVTFVGERRLAPEHIRLIEQWVEQGAAEGDAADRRPPPQWSSGWQLGDPDLVVALAEPYALSESGPDVFRNFVLPIPLSSPRFVRGIEVRTDGRGVVHHATLLIDRTRASRMLDARDPLPGYEGMFSDTARNPDSLALGWTPGMTPVLEPQEAAWRLETGSDLVVQMHMIRSGRPESVKPEIGFFFTDAAPSRTPMDFRLGSKTIDIPAGQADYAIEDTYTIPADVDVLSVYPHAHYLAKEMTVSARQPDGRTASLLWIKNWDFKWQDQYRFATPVMLSKGAVVTMRFSYDNSADNPRNPRRPPTRVVFGPQSSDEMGDVWLRLLPKAGSDAVLFARDYQSRELAKNVASAERGVDREPGSAGAQSLLGTRLLEAGRIPEAIARFREAIRLDPRHAESHNNLGEALRRSGRTNDALPLLRRAAALAPDNDRVHYNLANALQDAGRLDEAIAHFRRSVALNPDAAEAHNDLGVALGSSGRIDEAIVEFRRALEIRSNYSDAQRNLDLALKVGRF